VTVITYSRMVLHTLKAAEELEKERDQPGSHRSPHPLAHGLEAIAKSVTKTNRVIVAHRSLHPRWGWG